MKNAAAAKDNNGAYRKISVERLKRRERAPREKIEAISGSDRLTRDEIHEPRK